MTDYLEKAGLQHDLDTLGFNLVGYGCTYPASAIPVRCLRKSPRPSRTMGSPSLRCCRETAISRAEVNHDVRADYLASPPRVVAYALAGSVMVDLTTEPLGTDAAGEPVYLKDIWPSSKAVAKTVRKAVKKSMFRKRYGNVFEGDKWQGIEVTGGLTYEWDVKSTYVRGRLISSISPIRRSRSPTSSMPASSACSSIYHHGPHLPPARSSATARQGAISPSMAWRRTTSIRLAARQSRR